MDKSEMRRIAQRYKPPLSACPRAMQRALGVTYRRYSKKRYSPSDHEIESCFNQRYGANPKGE